MSEHRLIYADELKNIIDGSEEFIDWQKREICECIDCCDTAYDVDNVVGRFEETFDRWGLDDGKKEIMREIVKGGVE